MVIAVLRHRLCGGAIDGAKERPSTVHHIHTDGLALGGEEAAGRVDKPSSRIDTNKESASSLVCTQIRDVRAIGLAIVRWEQMEEREQATRELLLHVRRDAARAWELRGSTRCD